MRVFVVALALSAALSAGPSFAQVPAPAAQAPAAQPAPARPGFQEGLKYAFVRIQEIAATSNEGKALNAKVQALQEQKIKELQDRQKALTAAQQKLETGGSVLSDQARVQLQADIDKQQRDMQRFSEDAQQEVTALAQQLQLEFERRLTPVINQVATEKKVHFIFNAEDSGLIWADPTMDLTLEVIEALDAGPSAAATPPAPAAN